MRLKKLKISKTLVEIQKEELIKFGAMLKASRASANLTQAKVAKALGYSTPQFISNWERGVAMPPFIQIRKLVAMYKLDRKMVLERLISMERKLLQSRLFSDQNEE